MGFARQWPVDRSARYFEICSWPSANPRGTERQRRRVESSGIIVFPIAFEADCLWSPLPQAIDDSAAAGRLLQPK